jgi:hypothetical protein
MKKTLLLPLLLMLLSGCSEKEQFEQAVLKDMEKDQDIKDYKIDPENITKCVVEGMSRKMPGIFFGDPKRWEAYLLYTKMIGLSEAENPEQTLKELQADFGEGRGLAKAKGLYAENVTECIARMMMEFGEPEPEPPTS